MNRRGKLRAASLTQIPKGRVELVHRRFGHRSLSFASPTKIGNLSAVPGPGRFESAGPVNPDIWPNAHTLINIADVQALDPDCPACPVSPASSAAAARTTPMRSCSLHPASTTPPEECRANTCEFWTAGNQAVAPGSGVQERKTWAPEIEALRSTKLGSPLK